MKWAFLSFGFFGRGKDKKKDVHAHPFFIVYRSNYKFASHFLPDLVNVHAYRPPTMATPTA